MTQNQISNEANNIREDELAETTRHNLATEANNKEQLELVRRQQDLDAYYKSEANRIQEAYNTAYLEYQTASTDRKLDLEEYLASLKEQQVLNENNYRDQTAINNAVLTGLKHDEIAETTRHNQQTEQLGQTANVLKEKQLEYDKYAFRESQKLKREELSQQYNLTMEGYGNQQLITTQNNLAAYHREEMKMNKQAEISADANTSRENIAEKSLAEQKREFDAGLVKDYTAIGAGVYNNASSNLTKMVTGALPLLF